MREDKTQKLRRDWKNICKNLKAASARNLIWGILTSLIIKIRLDFSKLPRLLLDVSCCFHFLKTQSNSTHLFSEAKQKLSAVLLRSCSTSGEEKVFWRVAEEKKLTGNKWFVWIWIKKIWNIKDECVWIFSKRKIISENV